MRSKVFYGWIIVAIAAVVLLVTSGTRAAPGALLVNMEEDTGWGRSELSLSAAIGLVAYGMGGPFAGGLLRRFGIRAVTLASLAITAVSMYFSSRVTSLIGLSLWFGLLTGVAAGLVAGVLGAAVANRWFVAKRGVVTGIFGASQSAGQLVFFPLLTGIAAAAGWRSALVWTAGISAAIVPVVLFFMKESPADLGLAPLGGQPEPAIPADRGIMRKAIRRPEFWLVAGTFMVCGGTSNGLVGQHFIAHASDHGFDQVTAANWLAVMGMFNFVGTVGSGILTDRVDPRRLLLTYYAFRGVSLMFLPLIHSNLSIGLFAVLFGLDYIATVPPTVMLCANLFGRHNAGVVYGWVFAAHQIGAAGAAWGAGVVRDSTGSYGWAFSTAGAIAVAAGLAALLINDKSAGVGTPEPVPA